MAENKTSQTISTIYINGLRGRMLRLSAKDKNKKRELLLIYGHHASLERMEGIAQNLSQYSNVTLPDLPGFGGMASLYKINKKPTIDNYADYLASFIKLKFKRKRLSIMSMSFSFLIVTRMLQKYPELSDKIDFVISAVGFVHYQDFRLPRPQIFGLRLLASFCQYRLTAAVFRHTLLNSKVISAIYKSVAHRHSKMHDAKSSKELEKRIRAEIKLWHINDVRTRMFTISEMFKVNLCDEKIDLPVYHISVENDRYFDNHTVEQHMRVIYKEFIDMPTTLPAHMPTIVATKEEVEPFIPQKLRELLN
ncbi:alpha/beta hydrolase [Candidatus Parcubacteria bacterium]|nr:alpha/beta hydrolase [Candidatus Parcubacteria bacterium]